VTVHFEGPIIFISYEDLYGVDFLRRDVNNCSERSCRLCTLWDIHKMHPTRSFSRRSVRVLEKY
jgi:hypothetical protein